MDFSSSLIGKVAIFKVNLYISLHQKLYMSNVIKSIISKMSIIDSEIPKEPSLPSKNYY